MEMKFTKRNSCLEGGENLTRSLYIHSLDRSMSGHESVHYFVLLNFVTNNTIKTATQSITTKNKLHIMEDRLWKVSSPMK
mmetsp:Transcript_20385/g.40750  ORF Transcript_20385/g.40750 Transcript_20385/m.40750 type:complete len:80 (+) Transcript_20385:197-436(+)